MSADPRFARGRRAAVALLIVPAALPLFASDPFLLRLSVLTVIASIVLLGLNIVTGFAGPVSLCQAAFYGIGAYVSGIISLRWGFPIPLSIAAGALATAAVAFLVGAGTLRLRSHYLALATIGFGEIATNVFRSATKWTGGASGLSDIPKADMSPAAYYWVVLVLAAVIFWVATRVLSSQTGLAIEAMREDELAAESMGVATRRMKIGAFTAAGFLAGLAGALYAHLDGFIGPESFSTSHSILLLCAVVVGGLASIGGCVFAALLLVIVQEYFRSFMDYQILLFGLTVIVIMIAAPGGARTLLTALLPRRRAASFDPAPVADAPEAPESGGNGHGRLSSGGPKLKVSQVALSFGGVQALDQVDFQVAEGEALCLIGPNGAGKTTLLNVMQGLQSPDRGGVSLRVDQGRDKWLRVRRVPLHRVARCGVSRVFQHNRVFKDLTCFENVLMGMHLNRKLKPSVAETLFRPRRAATKDRVARQEAALLLNEVGLWAVNDEKAALLPFGAQRLLEIARAAAAQPDVLLLDEQSAGLTAAECGILLQMLRRFRQRGTTMVIVAHDLDLVRNLSDRVVVLSEAHVIFDGPASELNQDRRVVEAYLGVEEAADAHD